MSATPGTMLTLQQAWALLQPQIPAARLVGEGVTALARVHTDTRTLQPGDLFVALKGERFDANAFLADARAGGAAAAIAHGGLAAAAPPTEQQQKTMESLEGPHGATH
jgi:UDP-N-acetylmuramoyl-tripeptide--D-alanyl-D-alanine ligase